MHDQRAPLRNLTGSYRRPHRSRRKCERPAVRSLRLPFDYPFDVIYRTGLDASTDGLRHTCVSLLLALGVHSRVVMEIVVHSAIEMTMNVYGHVNLETQRRALDELDRVLQ